MITKRIIVSLTSWPKRIGNVFTVCTSLLQQTQKPDLIEINLSIEEFPNKEKDLPLDLQKLLIAEPTMEINWVDKNTGVFKKIIPTLQKFYGEDYYLLSVDDDCLYAPTYIKTILELFLKHNTDTFCLGWWKFWGTCMIYKSTVFKADFWEKLTDEIIALGMDDEWVEHYLEHYKKTSSNERPKYLNNITKSYNDVFPNSEGGYTQERIDKVYNAMNKIEL